MSKPIPLISFSIIVGLLLGYYITTNFFSEPIPSGYVRATVKNKSGQKIKSLTLKHQNGSIEMKKLSDQESVNLIFKNEGENSYRIFAQLQNDSMVSSKGNYVEAGYRTTEMIFEDTIITEIDK
jgi:hypothetical protein